MAKQILYDMEAKKKLVSGILKLTQVVQVTMGPKGRHVAIGKSFTSPQVTRDGVTVAKSIELPDHMENIGAELVKMVASRTAEQVGDGTTTATILARAIFLRSLKYVAAGADETQVKIGIERGFHAVEKELKRISIPVDHSDKIKQVATISANNDAELGELVAKSIERVGKDGIVTIEEISGMNSYLSFTDGTKIKSGYLSHHFITNTSKSTVEYDDPLFLVTTFKIGLLTEILPVLEIVMQTGKPLIIIADSIETEALSALVLNNSKGVLRVAAIKSPGFGEQKKEMLEDLCSIVGATLISEEEGHRLNKVVLEHLGSAKKIVMDKDESKILEGAGEKSAIQKKIAELKSQFANSGKHNQERINERISFLTGGVVQINLAAHTESEMQEKMDRVDDALQATRAALEEGFVAGGGVALIRCASTLDSIKTDNEDQTVGLKIFRLALEEPAYTIALNAGAEAKVVVDKIRDGKDDFGFNASEGTFEKLIDAGIIDPCKVVRLALQNAVSVAGMMLSTYCLIADEEVSVPIETKYIN